jgi:hypothetical protein
MFSPFGTPPSLAGGSEPDGQTPRTRMPGAAVALPGAAASAILRLPQTAVQRG